MNYSNPRTKVVIEDWPTGSYRTKAVFEVEVSPKKGERATRYTLHPVTGIPGATKKLTFALQMRIVDGSDGRTYILARSPYHLVVWQGNMQFNQETIHSDDPRFEELMGLFN